MTDKSIHEVTRLQLDYCWRWWEYHAKQRMTMFYYYLIMIGVLANAWALTLDRELSTVAIGISIMGVVTSVAAIFFDMRNGALIKAAADIMKQIEQEVLFSAEDGKDNRSPLVGPLSSDCQGNTKKREKHKWQRLCKHTFWIRLIEALFAVGFVLLTAIGCWTKRLRRMTTTH